MTLVRILLSNLEFNFSLKLLVQKLVIKTKSNSTSESRRLDFLKIFAENLCQRSKTKSVTEKVEEILENLKVRKMPMEKIRSQ